MESILLGFLISSLYTLIYNANKIGLLDDKTFKNIKIMFRTKVLKTHVLSTMVTASFILNNLIKT